MWQINNQAFAPHAVNTMALRLIYPFYHLLLLLLLLSELELLQTSNKIL